MKHLNVAVAVVYRNSRILITRRKSGGVLGGFWEFPGGKLEAGETLEDCVRRELMEELGIAVQPVVSLTPISYQYPDRHITLHSFLCTHEYESGEPQPIACDEFRWVPADQLTAYRFPPANEPLLEQIMLSFPSAAV